MRLTRRAIGATRIALLTVGLMLLPVAVASAEPDFSATLNAANSKFTWESSGTGVPDYSSQLRCTGEPFTCEYILIDVQTRGELTLTLDGGAGSDLDDPTGEVCGDAPCSVFADIDGYLYESNAAGEPQGESLTDYGCVTGSSRETCKVVVAPGLYVFEVEYYRAREAAYVGTAELVPDPSPPPALEQKIALEGCNLTFYYFKDSAERLQALVPPGYRVRPHWSYGGALTGGASTPEGSGTIAAAAYDCDRVEAPGSSPAPGIFTVLSVLVHPPGGEEDHDGPAASDFYVLWVHADNPQLVEPLASRGMPAHLVPGMVFEKPLQSLAVRTEVPWSAGAYELAMTGFPQHETLLPHSHDNSFWHDAADGRRVRMDFLTPEALDNLCLEPDHDHHAGQCGKLTARAGTPVAGFFGASDRTADNAWDHEPLEHSRLELSVSPPAASGVQSPPPPPPPQPSQHSHSTPAGLLPLSGPLTVSVAADSGTRSTARKRGLRVRVRCSVQCTSSAVATIGRKAARRLGLGREAVRIASGKSTITRAGRIPFFLELSPKAKKTLARRKVKQLAVKIVVTVTDRQGQQPKRVTKKITLR